jgi:steroid delta-isomerase-like uncharacterized protein
MENIGLKEIAENYMQIWNVGSDSLLDKWANNDLNVEYTHFQKTIVGIDEYRQVLKQTHHFFPDIKISVQEVNVSVNKAIVEWTYTGTHQNNTLFGVDPAEKKVTVSGLSILDINGGKVVREYGIVDNLSLIMQLGALEI